MGHFILSNSWRIYVSLRCFGIYPFKRIGDSELKSTTKCHFWLIYILTFVICIGMGIFYQFMIYATHVGSYIHEWRSNASIVTETYDSHERDLGNHVTKKYENMLHSTSIYLRLFLHIPFCFLLRIFAKELPIIQEEVNSIDSVYNNHTASIKNFLFDQYSTKKDKYVILHIIPLIIIMMFIFMVKIPICK